MSGMPPIEEQVSDHLSDRTKETYIEMVNSASDDMMRMLKHHSSNLFDTFGNSSHYADMHPHMMRTFHAFLIHDMLDVGSGSTTLLMPVSGSEG